MPKRNTFRFFVNTEWSMKTDRAQVFSTLHDYYGKKDFQDRCFNALHAAFKPLSMALSGSSQAEVLREVSAARDRVEMLLNLALDLAAPAPDMDTEFATYAQATSVDPSPVVDRDQELIPTVYSDQENNSNSLMEDFNDDD